MLLRRGLVWVWEGPAVRRPGLWTVFHIETWGLAGDRDVKQGEMEAVKEDKDLSQSSQRPLPSCDLALAQLVVLARALMTKRTQGAGMWQTWLPLHSGA